MSIPETPRPLVSVVMANYRGAAYLRHAIDSVLGQSVRDLELIVVDDLSGDDSVRIVEECAGRDGRVRLIALERNLGPAGARNRGLDAARGEWIAIVDSDDMIHPDRLRILIDAAEADGADIAADDLLIFDEASTAIRTMLERDVPAFWVSVPDFIRSNAIYGSAPVLGYCKPLIRAKALAGIRYDESLRIGEDSDLLLRLMIAGRRFRFYPELLYFYRKHGLSISHRFGEAECLSLIAAEEALIRRHAALGPEIAAAHAFRLASLRRALAFEHLIRALKTRSLPGALRALREDPSVLPLLRMPILALGRRLLATLRPTRRSEDRRRRVLVLSRQRIAGPTNGSSAYLLSIAAYLRGRGYRVDYLSPSPATFGRWPFLKFVEGTRAGFEGFAVHGGVRVGSYLVNSDPKVWVRAFLTVAEDVLKRARLIGRRRIAPAPYSISVPLTRRDKLFLARAARGADSLLLDYAFLAPARPYALSPDARALIVMHDLFSSRQAQFQKAGAADSVALLTEEEEFALLARADGVLAIQQEEAQIVAARLPAVPVIVTPMAVPVRPAPAPGQDDTMVFVGSNTAPNVIGLNWFLAEVWPQVAAARPNAVLKIAGSVARAISGLPAGVQCLGVVPDLAPVYEAAGVVVSPLTAGSGLKIKLVEAMGEGKAVVATSVSVQGIAERVSGAVLVEDDPAAFAGALIGLLGDCGKRAELGRAAIEIARADFAAEACYGALPAHLFPDPAPATAATAGTPVRTAPDLRRSVSVRT